MPLKFNNDYPGDEIKKINDSLSFDLKLAFGVENMSELKGPEHDLFTLADKAIEEKKPLPRIFHARGCNDFIIECARTSCDWFSKKPFDYIYQEESGDHTWELWNK